MVQLKSQVHQHRRTGARYTLSILFGCAVDLGNEEITKDTQKLKDLACKNRKIRPLVMVLQHFKVGVVVLVNVCTIPLGFPLKGNNELL